VGTALGTPATSVGDLEPLRSGDPETRALDDADTR
jgi:hypothetical protein